jgi:hypothetical protein
VDLHSTTDRQSALMKRLLLMSAVMIGLAAGAVIPATASVRDSALGHAEFVSGNARAINYYRLVQYPGAGFGGFYAQIAHARRTIDMEMYELADQTAESELAAAAARGVRVRVLLDRDFSGAKVNRSAVSYLAARRVDVGWAPAGYIFHIKTTTFDAHTSDISTANLVSYEPGELCSNADHGMTGIAGNGEAIICENKNGWRWEPE